MATSDEPGYHEAEDEEYESDRDPETGLRRISQTEDLSRITYSREATITAFRDYYEVLQTMYLDEERITWPPEGGWPDITVEKMRSLGKTDEVVALLSQLPYVQNPPHDADMKIHTLGRCQFANWTKIARLVSEGDPGYAKNMTELPWEDAMPAHVVGLCNRGEKIFLDTKLGVIYHVECPFEIREDPNLPHKPIEDEAYDYAPENEAEWRGLGAAWEITEYFEVMKYLFRELKYVPMTRLFVEEAWADDRQPDSLGARAVAQEIFRKHGWPNELERYRKKECLDEVERVIEERWPSTFIPYL